MSASVPWKIFTDCCLRTYSPCHLVTPSRSQVSRLMEENRRLQHRLVKYEASPQQARYKYARQTAAANATSASKPMGSDGRKHGNSTAALTAAAAVVRKRETEQTATKEARTAQGGGGGRNSTVSCLNSRGSAAFADRVLLR